MKWLFIVLVTANALLTQASETYARGHRRNRSCRVSRRCLCPLPCPKPIEPIEPILPIIPVVPEPKPELDISSLRKPVVGRNRVEWGAVFCMSKISQIVYSDEALAKQQLDELGLNSHAIVVGSMIAHVAWNDDFVVIAFRGTDASQLADWIINIDFFSDVLNEGRIHRGWHAAYKSLEPGILAAIPKDEGKEKKLWITGHSLGGALAIVCNYSLIQQGISPSSTVTFGQPMVVDHSLAVFLASRMTGRYVRLVNEDDVVPKVPPWTYVHFGKLAWFQGESVVVRGRQYAGTGSRTRVSDRQFPPGQRRLTSRSSNNSKEHLLRIATK